MNSKNEEGKMVKKCGDAGLLKMKGACGEEVSLEEAFRCIGCGKWFHLDCIWDHFEQEEGQDRARFYLKKIQERAKDKLTKRYCRLGLERVKPSITWPWDKLSSSQQ